MSDDYLRGVAEREEAVRQVRARIDRLESERDRLEAAIDRHRADVAESTLHTPSWIDRALYAVLREIRNERDAAPGGRGGEP